MQYCAFSARRKPACYNDRMSGSRAIPVRFYTKPGCHLCEDAADALEAISRDVPLAIEAIDITTDLDLHRRFWDKIPVLDIDGHWLHAPIRMPELRATLRAAAKET